MQGLRSEEGRWTLSVLKKGKHLHKLWCHCLKKALQLLVYASNWKTYNNWLEEILRIEMIKNGNYLFLYWLKQSCSDILLPSEETEKSFDNHQHFSRRSH